MDSEANAPELHWVELNFAARTFDTFILSLPGRQQGAELEERWLELIRRGFGVVQFGRRLLFMQESQGTV